jgi:septum formation protein
VNNPSLILASSSPRRRELISLLNLPVAIQPSEADETVPNGLPPAAIVEELSLRKAAAVRNANRTNGRMGIIIGSDTIVVAAGRILGKPRDRSEAKAMLSGLQGRTHEVYTGIACMDASVEADPDPASIRADQADAARAGRNGSFRIVSETGCGRPAIIAGSTVSRVTFQPMSEAEIDAYIETGEPMDKAGGYNTTMHLGDIGQYRVVSESPSGEPEIIVGHTVSKVTFRPMSDEEIWAYVKTGDPLDKAGAYGVQGIGSVFIEKIEGDFYSIMGLPLNLLYQMLLMFGISLFNQS